MFTGAGDNSSIVMSTSNVVKEFVLSLAGGVSYTWRPSSAGVWSLPNTHGDVVATTNTTGVLQGGIASFDPFGNPLGATGVKDNSDGNLDYGWHGTAQRGLDHETGMQPTINMGARPYQPGLGRFLATDPVEGGTPNDYLYVADPFNGSDLSGMRQDGGGQGSSHCSKSAIASYNCKIILWMAVLSAQESSRRKNCPKSGPVLGTFGMISASCAISHGNFLPVAQSGTQTAAAKLTGWSWLKFLNSSPVALGFTLIEIPVYAGQQPPRPSPPRFPTTATTVLPASPPLAPIVVTPSYPYADQGPFAAGGANGAQAQAMYGG